MVTTDVDNDVDHICRFDKYVVTGRSARANSGLFLTAAIGSHLAQSDA
jgi:hypothetical protein